MRNEEERGLIIRWPSRLPHGPTQWVPTDQRIRRWNIRPGDKVRLLVGKPAEKYVDEREKAAGGWKVYNVKNVDMERNWVYLDGLSVSVKFAHQCASERPGEEGELDCKGGPEGNGRDVRGGRHGRNQRKGEGDGFNEQSAERLMVLEVMS